jgi:hypothetical protein
VPYWLLKKLQFSSVGCSIAQLVVCWLAVCKAVPGSILSSATAEFFQLSRQAMRKARISRLLLYK